uniref:Taste receptor type 2 n=1 Tax=Pogona vitticeps TaxID=103695 RepID=A0ABM5FHX7_9SAUR
MVALTSSLDITFWTIMEIEVISSVLVNGFITFVNGYLWFQNRKMVLCDILLTALSTSRCLMQLTALVINGLYFISPDNFFSSDQVDILFLVWFFFETVSLWCNTWLNVFYCVKVTNFPNHLFLWLKTRISALTLKLLGMSIVVSMIFSLPSAISYYDQKKWCNRTGMQTLNLSQSKICKDRTLVFLLPELIVFSINFIMNITASILLLLSLWRHTRNLRKSGIGVKDLNTQIHVNVIKSLICYVFFYFLYFAGMIIYADSRVNYRPIAVTISSILLSLLPLSHSIILILTNPKLKNWFACLLNFKRIALQR